MLSIIIEDFKKTSAKYVVIIKKVPWILGSHAFLFIIILVALGMMSGGVLFYKYVVVATIQKVEITDSLETFQKKAYESILASWKVREAAIENLAKEEYNNPF